MIAVVIPCYRVKDHIVSVLSRIGPEVDRIYVVDDCCPQQTGQFVQEQSVDPRVSVIVHTQNKGVGGAVVTGYRQAIAEDCSVIVKIDGDDQMDPSLLPMFVSPILAGQADYTKGNRFFHLESSRGMPLVRLLGNVGLSFMTKLSTGYWRVMDPTNGYTALSVEVARLLPLEKLAERYFFETDMLFRLGTLGAVVVDIPMQASYGEEESNLRVSAVLRQFPRLHGNRLFKRIFYGYVLRDFSIATLELCFGILLTCFGVCYGSFEWIRYAHLGVGAPTGTVVIAALSVALGFQLLLSWLSFDMQKESNLPLTRLLVNRKRSFPLNRSMHEE